MYNSYWDIREYFIHNYSDKNLLLKHNLQESNEKVENTEILQASQLRLQTFNFSY